MKLPYVLTVIFFAFTGVNYAQDAMENVKYGEQYLNIKTENLNKYLNKSGKLEERLLRGIKRKEARLLRKLSKKDPEAGKAYLSRQLEVDSLERALRADSLRPGSKKYAGIDSLRGILEFVNKERSGISGKVFKEGDPLKDNGYSEKISELEKQLDYQGQLKDIVDKKQRLLQDALGKHQLPGSLNLQKSSYYTREKIKHLRALADEPEESEEMALEYLQGVEGFEQYLKPQALQRGGSGGKASVEELENSGYVTKARMTEMLAEKFGGNTGNMQKMMGEQLQQYQEQLDQVKEQANSWKDSYAEAEEALKAGRAMGQGVRQLEKPSFKIRPMRGLPFWQRLRYRYDFQTAKSVAGERPAMLHIGASVMYRQTEKWSWGLGMAASAGMGQSWQSLKLSYEGLRLRASSDYEMLPGIRMEAGYEQVFRSFTSGDEWPAAEAAEGGVLRNLTGGREEVAYAGLTKAYRINKKWKGSLLLGYNFLWRQYGSAPLLLRLGWER